MTFSPLLSAFRFFAAALAACAFVIAPVAEAQHLDFDPAAACEAAQADSDADRDAPDHGDHDHHAHNCGTCHLHVLRRDVSATAFMEDGERSVRPPLTEDMVSLPPGSLYRPPRA